ncbi:MAG: hypothetical protein ACI4E2_00540 [Acetatifactor sp.]
MNLKKSLLTLFCIAAIVCTTTLGSMAISIAYNTDTMKCVAEVTNVDSSAVTLSLNTNPTSGQYGVRVNVTTTSGAVVASRDFPFYTSIPSLTTTIPSKETREVWVGPVSAGQRVSGNLAYSVY